MFANVGLVSHREFKKFCIANEERILAAQALAKKKSLEELARRRRERGEVEQKPTPQAMPDTMVNKSEYLNGTSIRQLARAESAGNEAKTQLFETLDTLPMSTYKGTTLQITTAQECL